MNAHYTVTPVPHHHVQYEGSPTLPESMSPQGWSVCASAMRGHDEAMAKDYKEELDTTLVFTGLLSAVITAFLAGSYSMLQEDNAQSMTRLLVEVTIQIGNAATPAGNPALDSLRPRPFQVTPAAIRINILWFLSLVLSLVTALFALLVKQWLRRYMSWTAVTRPRDSVALRQFRYDALSRWQVFRTIGTLPLLLQISVILFLVGVVDLLWSLNTVVAAVVTIVITVSISMAIGSAILPSFMPNCPYRSPVAWTTSRFVSWVHRVVQKFHRGLLMMSRWGVDPVKDEEKVAPADSWQEKDMRTLERLTTSSYYERRSLTWGFKRFMDHERLDALTHCLGDVARKEDMLKCLFDVLARDMQKTSTFLRDDIRRSWDAGVTAEQYGPRNKHVVHQHFHMTLVVLERMANTWELESLLEVLLLLRYVSVPSACIDSSDSVLQRFVNALLNILTRRLELHPASVGERVLIVSAECLFDLCRRYFDDERAGYSQTWSWFSPAEITELLRNAVQMYNSPRAALRRLKGDTNSDRLFLHTTSIALYALARSKSGHDSHGVVFAFRELAGLLEAPIAQCTAEHRHDPIIAGWTAALCVLAERDHNIIPPKLVSVMGAWLRRNGDSQQAATMRLLANRADPEAPDDRDELASNVSTAEYQEAPTSQTRVYRIRSGLRSAISWMDGPELGGVVPFTRPSSPTGDSLSPHAVPR